MTDIANLKFAWLAARRAEQAANAERIAIEQQILQLMPAKDEGTVTESGVSVTYKLTRTLDTQGLRSDWNALPPRAQAALRWKAELDTSAYRSLQAEDDIASNVLARYITSKPAKPTIAIKE